MQQGGIDHIIVFSDPAECLLKVVFGDALDFFEDLKLVDLAQRNDTARSILVAINIIARCFMNENIDFVLCRQLRKLGVGGFNGVIVFKADDDVRINEIRLSAHLSGPFLDRVSHTKMIGAAQSQIVLLGR